MSVSVSVSYQWAFNQNSGSRRVSIMTKETDVPAFEPYLTNKEISVKITQRKQVERAKQQEQFHEVGSTDVLSHESFPILVLQLTPW